MYMNGRRRRKRINYVGRLCLPEIAMGPMAEGRMLLGRNAIGGWALAGTATFVWQQLASGCVCTGAEGEGWNGGIGMRMKREDVSVIVLCYKKRWAQPGREWAELIIREPVFCRVEDAVHVVDLERSHGAAPPQTRTSWARCGAVSAVLRVYWTAQRRLSPPPHGQNRCGARAAQPPPVLAGLLSLLLSWLVCVCSVCRVCRSQGLLRVGFGLVRFVFGSLLADVACCVSPKAKAELPEISSVSAGPDTTRRERRRAQAVLV